MNKNEREAIEVLKINRLIAESLLDNVNASAYSLGIEALEKQIGKFPCRISHFKEGDIGYCQECDTILTNISSNYCNNCGQRTLWEKYNV